MKSIYRVEMKVFITPLFIYRYSVLHSPHISTQRDSPSQKAAANWVAGRMEGMRATGMRKTDEKYGANKKYYASNFSLELFSQSSTVNRDGDRSVGRKGVADTADSDMKRDGKQMTRTRNKYGRKENLRVTRGSLQDRELQNRWAWRKEVKFWEIK